MYGSGGRGPIDSGVVLTEGSRKGHSRRRLRVIRITLSETLEYAAQHAKPEGGNPGNDVVDRVLDEDGVDL